MRAHLVLPFGATIVLALFAERGSAQRISTLSETSDCVLLVPASRTSGDDNLRGHGPGYSVRFGHNGIVFRSELGSSSSNVSSRMV